MAAFTHYWSRQTWDDHSEDEGEVLLRTAGNQFLEKGLLKDDAVFIVTIKGGQMFLLSRGIVIKINDRNEELKTRKNAWDAEEHVKLRNGTPKRFDRKVPNEIVEQLRFGDDKPLTYKSKGMLDSQTLRGVRKLTPASSELLSSFIDSEKR